MESKLCANCFAGLAASGEACPVCGWDNSKPQLPEALPCFTVVSTRYQVGRVKAINGEGITYAALDLSTRKEVELREFFPFALACRRKDDGTVVPNAGQEQLFEQYLDQFLELQKNISRLREVTVVHSVLDLFEENYTAYAVYEYVPAVSLRRYVENAGGTLSWNTANRLFQPVVSALGLMNSLGISHLGISPDSLRVTGDGMVLITSFSIQAARRMGSALEADLAPGFAALEQYTEKARCGEPSDVYALAATLLYILTGQAPQEAPRRLKDQRLMISKEVLHALPPFVVTAVANALQVRPDKRTASFERFKSELAAAPTLMDEVDQTEAIRRFPRGKGRPPLCGWWVRLWLPSWR